LTFSNGTLILIDYTAKVKNTDEVFDTTIEAAAKKYSLHDPNIKYQPKLISVGEKWVIKGLDDALANTSVGDKKTIEITPDKGFGERDKGKVRMIPLRKLGEDAEKVSIGDTIEIDNKKGVIRFIGSGRVQIDYNHRFAGKTILYDVNVLKEIKSDEEKTTEILRKDIPVDNDKISFKKSGNILDISIPQEIFRIDGLQVIKHLTQMDIFKFVPTLEKINFIETHVNKTTKPQEKKPEDTKTKSQDIKKTSKTK
jgi:peptidylprolyl isomerase